MMPAWPDLTPEEWRQRVASLKTEKRYNPDQPRDPAGTPTGGRWQEVPPVTTLSFEDAMRGPDAES